MDIILINWVLLIHYRGCHARKYCQGTISLVKCKDFHFVYGMLFKYISKDF